MQQGKTVRKDVGWTNKVMEIESEKGRGQLLVSGKYSNYSLGNGLIIHNSPSLNSGIGKHYMIAMPCCYRRKKRTYPLMKK